MGREISYCHVCGHRLLESDFREGRASVQDGRRLCASCHPVAVLPVPERRKSSTRIHAQTCVRRTRETTRIRRKPLGLRLAFGGIAAAAVATGIAIGAGSSSSPEPREALPVTQAQAGPPRSEPKAGPGPSADELLKQAREIRDGDLMFDRREDVIRLLREAAGKSGSRREEIDLLTAEYDRKFEEAAARLADFLRSEAARLSAKQKYQEAVSRLEGYPAAFRSSRAAGPLRILREELERRRLEAAAPASGSPQRFYSEPASNCPVARAPRRRF